MAESLPPTKSPKPVQQLAAEACKQVPENYIQSKDADIQPSCPLLDLASIDLSLLSSSTPSPAREKELTKLRSTLSSCGCFQAINHGISDDFLDKVGEIGKSFFALPIEEKQKYGRAADDTEGYGNDSVLSEHQILDWTDRLYLTVSPQEQIKYNLWPANPENFREVLEEYIKKLTALNELLLKAIALSLNLEENSFVNQFGDRDRASKVARFNFYPPCPSPDLVLGVKPHADGTVLTFLLQDKDVEGLQVLKDGQWFKVPIVPYAIVVNVGDQAEIMTNGVLKSPVHRVVTNTERERNTLAVFFCPDSNSEIGPVEKLITEERPRLYRNIRNFVGLFFQNYQQGKRPLDVVRI
nr:codeine O-demethylase-like [Ipomoea batatas]